MSTHERHALRPGSLLRVFLLCGVAGIISDASADHRPGHGGGGRDRTAPADVVDLAVDIAATTETSITIDWTASGDDGTDGTASSYDVRYSTAPILDDADFDTATQAAGEPAPQPSGSLETFTVSGLASSTTYYLALKVSDEAGNTSGLSNAVSETTLAPPPGTWTAETVDGSAQADNKRLAYDASGYPAIAYRDENGDLVTLARHNGVSWAIEIVDAGRNVDIAIDPITGEPAVSYRSGGNVMFAQFNRSTWDIEVVSTESVNGDTSLAFDGAGHPAISYVHRVSGGPPQNRGDFVKLARFNGASWDIENVASDGDSLLRSLAFDAAGNPGIAYVTDDLAGALKFARFNGSSWDIHTVEAAIDGWLFWVGFTYDPGGNPSIAYNVDDSTVIYARWNGSLWDKETAYVSAAPPCDATSLAFDPSGFPFIGIVEDTRVIVAHSNGTSWSIDIVESGIFPWGVASLAFDAAGFATIAYDDDHILRFAVE